MTVNDTVDNPMALLFLQVEAEIGKLEEKNKLGTILKRLSDSPFPSLSTPLRGHDDTRACS